MFSKAAVASVESTRAGILSLTHCGKEQKSYFQEEKWRESL